MKSKVWKQNYLTNILQKQNLLRFTWYQLLFNLRLDQKDSIIFILKSFVSMGPEPFQSQTSLKSYPTTTQLNVSTIANQIDPSLKQCRICLSNLNQIQNPLISPCKCTGSAKYLHHQCLITWFNLRLVQNNQQQIDNSSKLRCEICKQLIKAEVVVQIKCKKKEDIMNQIGNNKKKFICSVVILLISVVLISFSIFKIRDEQKKDYSSFSRFEKAVVILLLCLSLLLFFYGIFRLISICIIQEASLGISQRQ